MFNNPFSPLFGGRPDFFFGRQRILDSFDVAFNAHGSDYRTLFITGARGFGKTALLEQLSARAARHGWDVIDVNAENALQSFFRQVTRFDEVATSTDPRVEVKVFGSGGSLSGKGTQKTAHYTVDDLDTLLLAACDRSKVGIFVTIDEVQKVPLDDVSRICGAFQMASRKGQEVMLAVAGLPFAHREIAQHDGCTYMRRAAHEDLGLFTPAEMREAFSGALERVQGLSADDPAIDALVVGSSGHPYMMQLLGYHAVVIADNRADASEYTLSREDVADAMAEALPAYERRSLAPIIEALGCWEVRYLQAMAECMDENLEASTGFVAQRLGKDQNRVSYYRDRLMRDGIILAPRRGKVRFAIPYLRQYMGKRKVQSENARLVAEWGV